MDYQQLIDECDLLLKSGKINDVTNLLSELNVAQVPRSFRQGLAKICRRAVLVNLGLRLLHPIIRPSTAAEEPATAGEICEYSVLLLVNGSVSEAINLLQAVDSNKSSDALLYLGFCEIANWEYARAADCFQKYLDGTVDDYSRLIAKVNLASCDIILMRLDEAKDLLQEAVVAVENAQAYRLQGNCYELLGQVHFWENDFSKARAALERAHEIFAKVQTYDQLLIFKTESIMSALEKKSLDPLIHFRKEAVARKHWESVREADLFSLKVQYDQQMFDHLYFGTPMPAYRDRIAKLINGQASDTYFFGKKSDCFLDLKSGQMSGAFELTPGKKIHQVFAALVDDFYVPVNTGTLFSKLYPDEFFHADPSQARVRQILMRTRKWLKDNRIPASIEQIQSSYRLVIDGDFGIKVPLQTHEIDPFILRWQEIKNSFPASVTFSAQKIRKKLGWSRSTTHRVIEWAVEKSLLRKSGRGRTTFYQITSSQNEKNSKVA